MTEDEMIGWHHRLNGRESEQALGGGNAKRSWGFHVPPHLPSSRDLFQGIQQEECPVCSLFPSSFYMFSSK